MCVCVGGGGGLISVNYSENIKFFNVPLSPENKMYAFVLFIYCPNKGKSALISLSNYRFRINAHKSYETCPERLHTFNVNGLEFFSFKNGISNLT